MAIKIPILTSFDPKGMKIANRAIGDLKSSVSSLGSNFAALGVVLAGAGALIAKNVQALARIETINAQTAQTIKTMGNAANISATEVEGLAGRLESLTAIEAESIQEGANLLLTFGNIRNELGAGNDIFTQTTGIMVDMGVALKRGPVETATMLGKALNDPIRGITALRKVGVSFNEQQLEQVKAMQNAGDLMGAQKLILAELQNQYGGSGAAFAQTFTGQLQAMGHELGTIGEEATMAVMPALQGMIAEFRELIPVIGPQIKAAIESVDWAGFAQTVFNLGSFFIQNFDAISKTVAVLFALNTVFKTLSVIMAVVNAATVINTAVTTAMTAAKGGATIASGFLATAMNLIPFVAIATAIGLVTVGLLGAADAANKASGAIEGVQPYVPVDNTSSGGRGRGRRQTTPAPVVPTFSTGGFSGAGAGASAAADEIAKANEAAVKAQEEAARKEAEILKKRKDAFKSFQDSVKSLFSSIKDSIMSAFDLPKLGNSITSVTKNIGKLLERTRGFSENIKKLAGLGLNSALLQQVIAAGPQEGGRLAESLASGGSAAIAQLNASYGEFGALASSIASTGTRAEFAGQQTVNNYSVNVTGGLATGADVGRAVVNAISTYERQSGAAWRA
jgi:vacuolar-type H+-ATPase subunit E/Vma4